MKYAVEIGNEMKDERLSNSSETKNKEVAENEEDHS